MCVSYHYDVMLHSSLRDWSLITEREGYKTGGGEHVKLTPRKRGGGRKSFRHADREGGGTTSFGVVFMW